MTPEMKEAAERALQFQANAVKDKSSLAHGILLKPDGSANVYAFDNDFMSTWQKKNQLALMLIKELFEHQGALAFCSDSWVGRLPTGLARQQMPNDLGDWPAEYRSEALLCMVNQVGQQGKYVQQPYTRQGSKIIFGAVDWNMPASGRFVFDLRHGSVERAIAAVLTMGRDGYSTLQ